MLALLVLPLALHLDHRLGMVLSGPSVQELQVQVLEVALVYVYLALLVLVLLLRPVALHLDHVLAVVLFQVQELQVLHQVALV